MGTVKRGVVGCNQPPATSAELFGGGNEVDGATAYRQFRESDNPYDPKLDRTAFGTAMVGSPTQVKEGDKKDTQTNPPDASKHDQ